MPGYEVVILLDSDEDEAGVRKEVGDKVTSSEKLFNIEIYNVDELPDEE